VRRARRVDANHAQIRGVLRALCPVVEDLSDVGRGMPDLLLKTARGSVYLVEVKDGRRPPSERKLSPAEEATAVRWGASYRVVLSEDEAIALART